MPHGEELTHAPQQQQVNFPDCILSGLISLAVAWSRWGSRYALVVEAGQHEPRVVTRGSHWLPGARAT